MAANNYTERALEDLIEAHLIEHGGWRKGDPADFDPELALITTDLFAFVQATQPDTWDKLRQHHQTGLKAAILDRLTRVLDSKGTLDVARHGLHSSVSRSTSLPSALLTTSIPRSLRNTRRTAWSSPAR